MRRTPSASIFSSSTPQPADASASSSTSAACSAVRAASTLPDCTKDSGTPVASLKPRITSMLDCARRVSVSSAWISL